MRSVIVIGLILLWLATAVVAALWALGINLPFEPEPVTVFLGLLSSGLSGVVAYYSVQLQNTTEELEEEKFSISLALGYGYVLNFLEPAITALLTKENLHGAQPQIYIYIPGQLSELEPASRERILARIKTHDYQNELLHLDFKEGRARDLLTLRKKPGGSAIFFDFPNTLLTLTSLVDYKVESKRESFSEKAKLELGKQYIDKFHNHVQKLCASKGLTEYIKFTNSSLNFLKEN